MSAITTLPFLSTLGLAAILIFLLSTHCPHRVRLAVGLLAFAAGGIWGIVHWVDKTNRKPTQATILESTTRCEEARHYFHYKNIKGSASRRSNPGPYTNTKILYSLTVSLESHSTSKNPIKTTYKAGIIGSVITDKPQPYLDALKVHQKISVSYQKNSPTENLKIDWKKSGL